MEKEKVELTRFSKAIEKSLFLRTLRSPLRPQSPRVSCFVLRGSRLAFSSPFFYFIIIFFNFALKIEISRDDFLISYRVHMPEEMYLFLSVFIR